MLARGNSNASVRLRRAKSTASLKHHETSVEIIHIDPEIRRRDALAAASHAFERAQTRASRIIHSDNRASPNNNKTLHGNLIANETRPTPLLKKQSIRFAEPMSTPRRLHATAEEESPEIHSVDSMAAPPVPVIQNEVSPRPLSGELLNALPPFELRPALPPPPRQTVRKIKSLMNPLKSFSAVNVAGVFPAEDKQDSQTPRKFSRRGQNQNSDQSTGLSSDLTTEYGSQPMFRRRSYDQDAVINVRQGEFRKQAGEQRSKERPSFISLKHRRSRTFPKTVRSNALGRFGNGIGSDSARPPSTRSSGFTSRARKLSESMKLTFMRIIGRNQKPGLQVPAQQQEAHRNHFSEPHNEFVPEPYSANITDRLTSNLHESSVAVGGLQGFEAGRIGSIKSDASSGNLQKSRVSTWGDSSARNTSAASTLPQSHLWETTKREMSREEYSALTRLSLTKDAVSYPRSSLSSYGESFDSRNNKHSIDETAFAYGKARELSKTRQKKPVIGQDLTSISSEGSQGTTRVNRKHDTRETTYHSHVSRLPSHVRVSHAQSTNFGRESKNHIDGNNSMRSSGRFFTEHTPQQMAAYNEHLVLPNRKLRRKASFSIGHGPQNQVESVEDEANVMQYVYDNGEDELIYNDNTMRRIRKPTYLPTSEYYSSQAGGDKGIYLGSTSRHIPEVRDSLPSLAYDTDAKMPGGTTTTHSASVTTSRSQVPDRLAFSGKYSSETNEIGLPALAKLKRDGEGNRRMQEVRARIVGRRRETAQMYEDETDVAARQRVEPASQSIADQSLSRSRPGLRHTPSEQMIERYPALSPQSSLSTLKEKKSELLGRVSFESTRHGVSTSDEWRPTRDVRHSSVECLDGKSKATTSSKEAYNLYNDDPHFSKPFSSFSEQSARNAPGTGVDEAARLSNHSARLPSSNRPSIMDRQDFAPSISSSYDPVASQKAATVTKGVPPVRKSPYPGYDRQGPSLTEQYRGLAHSKRSAYVDPITRASPPTFTQNNSADEEFAMRDHGISSAVSPGSIIRHPHLRERPSHDSKTNSPASQVFKRANDRNSPERERRLQRSEQHGHRKDTKENVQTNVRRHTQPLYLLIVH